MNESVLRACADYHRKKSGDHDKIASQCDQSKRAHHEARSELHESFRVEIEAVLSFIAANRKTKTT